MMISVCGHAGPDLGEQVARIVDGLAEQRRSERERDAVNRTEPKVHRNDPAEQSEGGGSRAQGYDPKRAIGPEENREHARHRGQRKRARVAGDQRAAAHRHRARARELHGD